MDFGWLCVNAGSFLVCVCVCMCVCVCDVKGKKSTILVSDTDKVRGYAYTEAYEKSPYLPLNLVVNLKLL